MSWKRARAASCALLAASLVFCAIAATPGRAYAREVVEHRGGTVTHDGRTGRLSYGGDAGHVFDFRGVMPGDTVTWSFDISARDVEHPVSLYVLGADGGVVPPELAGVVLRLECDGRPIYKGPLTEGFAGAEPIELVDLEGSSTHVCSMSVEVPVELGPESMGALGEVGWQLIVQDDGAILPEGEWHAGGLPQTGEMAIPLAGLLGIAGAGILAIPVLLRRGRA